MSFYCFLLVPFSSPTPPTSTHFVFPFVRIFESGMARGDRRAKRRTGVTTATFLSDPSLTDQWRQRQAWRHFRAFSINGSSAATRRATRATPSVCFRRAARAGGARARVAAAAAAYFSAACCCALARAWRRRGGGSGVAQRTYPSTLYSSHLLPDRRRARRRARNRSSMLPDGRMACRSAARMRRGGFGHERGAVCPPSTLAQA